MSRALLLREVLGHELRQERRRRGMTLAQVAARAGVSTQYLSEVERGRKDASSEVVEAVGQALDLTLAGLAERIAGGSAATPASAWSRGRVISLRSVARGAPAAQEREPLSSASDSADADHVTARAATGRAATRLSVAA